MKGGEEPKHKYNGLFPSLRERERCRFLRLVGKRTVVSVSVSREYRKLCFGITSTLSSSDDDCEFVVKTKYSLENKRSKKVEFLGLRIKTNKKTSVAR